MVAWSADKSIIDLCFTSTRNWGLLNKTARNAGFLDLRDGARRWYPSSGTHWTSGPAAVLPAQDDSAYTAYCLSSQQLDTSMSNLLSQFRAIDEKKNHPSDQFRPPRAISTLDSRTSASTDGKSSCSSATRRWALPNRLSPGSVEHWNDEPHEFLDPRLLNAPTRRQSG